MNSKLTFLRGFKDGVPIMLGYLSVSFAFGMIAHSRGIPIWCTALFSMTNLSGTGQFVGLDLISAATGFLEIICTLAVINARYFLMSLSLGQKLPSSVSLWQRLIIAFGDTDEIFAVAMMQTEPLNFKYMFGLFLSSYMGWVGGSILGGAASGLIPDSVLSALGIALYAMFVALVVPPAKSSRPVLIVVLSAAAVSTLLNIIPVIKDIGSGWIIIIAGVAASLVGALLFPIEESEAENTADGGEAK